MIVLGGNVPAFEALKLHYSQLRERERALTTQNARLVSNLTGLMAKHEALLQHLAPLVEQLTIDVSNLLDPVAQGLPGDSWGPESTQHSENYKILRISNNLDQSNNPKNHPDPEPELELEPKILSADNSNHLNYPNHSSSSSGKSGKKSKKAKKDKEPRNIPGHVKNNKAVKRKKHKGQQDPGDEAGSSNIPNNPNNPAEVDPDSGLTFI